MFVRVKVLGSTNVYVREESWSQECHVFSDVMPAVWLSVYILEEIKLEDFREKSKYPHAI